MMERKRLFAVAALMLSLLGEVASASEARRGVSPLEPWMIGFWKISYNEDKMPPDTFEITADGDYIGQGMHCDFAFPATIHVYDGELFVRFVLPRKGPASFILKPDGRHNLSFTSTRTGNNAVYSKLPGNPCKAPTAAANAAAPKA